MDFPLTVPVMQSFCFISGYPEIAVEQMVELFVIWDTVHDLTVMTKLQFRHDLITFSKWTRW